VDPSDGAIWLGTGAADVLLRYHPRSSCFDTFPLPTKGALVRHMALDPRNGAVWLAYGASPGIPARVARVMVR
jgi:streptogramin lyase